MKKSLLTILLLLLCVPFSFAQQKIFIYLSDGTLIQKEIWEVDSITFEENAPFTLSTNQIPEAVDLGLSVKWASFNIGASQPEEKGVMVGWGDVTCANQSTNLKYFPVLSPTGNITTTKYDVAHQLLGSDWRMPSALEFEELRDKCTWEWNPAGYFVVSGNGNSIILPVSGVRNESDVTDGTTGNYWTGDLNKDDTKQAIGFKFGETGDKTLSSFMRYSGLALRPVFGKYKQGISVTPLPATGITLEGSTVPVTVSGDRTILSAVGVAYAYDKNGIDVEKGNKSQLTTIPSEGDVNITLSGLQPNKDVYYIAYALIDGSYVFSEDTLSFKTGNVKASAAMNITYTGATTTLIVDGDLSKISEAGVYYSVNNSVVDTTTAKTATAASIPTSGTINVTLDGFNELDTVYYRAYVVYGGVKIISNETMSFVTKTHFPEPEYVDLGLSVKWATWNVGAESESEVGTYIGWGDPTGTNSSYLAADYPTIDPSTTLSGTIHDIAHVKWGKKWMMPTMAQYQELQSKCTWAKVDKNGVAGWQITGANGNSIFLPQAGYYNPRGLTYHYVGTDAWYWTAEQNDNTEAYAANVFKWAANSKIIEKVLHLPIRAVYNEAPTSNTGGSTTTPTLPNESVPLSSSAGKAIDLGLSVKWADRNVGASSDSESGSYYAWGETSTKDSYTLATYTFYDSNTNTFTTPEGYDEISGSKYDAARMTWGGTWRMPTSDEIAELINNCTWVWDDNRGGYLVTSNINKNTIFLPSTGFMNDNTAYNVGMAGEYWSGTNYTREPMYLDKHGYRLVIQNQTDPYVMDSNKEIGRVIRPVQ